MDSVDTVDNELKNTARINSFGVHNFLSRKEEKNLKEQNIELFLIRQVSLKGGLCLKMNSITMKGLPDRLVLLPNVKMFFAELKAPGKKPRPEQVRVHESLRKLGFDVYVIDNTARVKEILNEICTAQVSGNGD